jgi:hypothetical protein
MDDATENLIAGLLPAVDQQLESPATPYVAKTLARLLAAGEDPAEARRLIAFCLADEANRMMIDRRPFDPNRYQTLLNALPDLPA